MIINSNNINHNTFVYNDNNLEEFPSYEYLGINIHHKLNYNHNIEERINRG